MTTKSAAVWAKRPDENVKQYRAFVDYRDMGTGRSLAKLLAKYTAKTYRKEPPCKSLKSLERWSKDHDWQGRVEAWENRQIASAETDRESLRRALIDRELSDYNRLLSKFDELIELTPLFTVSTAGSADGDKTPVKVLNASDWRQIIELRRLISSFGRLALGLPDKMAAQKPTEQASGAKTWRELVEQAEAEALAEAQMIEE